MQLDSFRLHTFRTLYAFRKNNASLTWQAVTHVLSYTISMTNCLYRSCLRGTNIISINQYNTINISLNSINWIANSTGDPAGSQTSFKFEPLLRPP
jgi:hypothetical protein